MEKSRYEVRINAKTHMVFDNVTGKFLGGFGSNFYRTWVFPLYTPSGQTVIQEFAHDHPFHNGFFVGQHPIIKDGKEANYWMAPPKRHNSDPNYRNLGRVDAPNTPKIEISEAGVRFISESIWRDEDENPVLDEVREVLFYSDENANAIICEMTSKKIASYGRLEYPVTKYGCIATRIEPRVLPTMGGIIIADNGRRGDEDKLHVTESDFIAYENSSAGNGTIGLLMTSLDPRVRGPWFVRNYGVAFLNLTMNQTVITEEGQDWTVSKRLVAYDGPLTDERIAKWTVNR